MRAGRRPVPGSKRGHSIDLEYWDDEHASYAHDRLVASDAPLLGRSTYETFAASWPQRSGDDFTTE
jgi:hypothetical protein